MKKRLPKLLYGGSINKSKKIIDVSQKIKKLIAKIKRDIKLKKI